MKDTTLFWNKIFHLNCRSTKRNADSMFRSLLNPDVRQYIMAFLDFYDSQNLEVYILFALFISDC